MNCGKCGQQMAVDAKFCAGCGEKIAEFTPNSGQQPEGDSTGGMIPYKNPKALFAYYIGLCSIIPFIGVVPGIIAVVLGILGLKDRAANPVIKGSVHAYIGIILGGFFTLLWGALIILPIIAILADSP